MHDHQQFPPWGTPTPAFWQTANGRETAADLEGAAQEEAVDHQPTEYREQIKAITDACGPPVDRHRLAAAAVDAEKLDQEFTARYGQGHLYTINLRELRGHLAYLQGNVSTAARWHLHAVGLRIQVEGGTHPAVQQAAARAISVWLSIPDTHDSRVLGAELLNMLAVVTGEDHAFCRKVRARMAALEQQEGAA